ncbi:Rieske 2Fe-2S domain-containing protein [Acidocella sp.]|uniref:Rieske 2Fe-2S domain-containing protein n=1 Tax=Acidocella sp. TaxID=50710 RepID=UPI003D08A1A2
MPDTPYRKATNLPFISICHTSALHEGGMGFFRAGKKSVLLLWPKGGEPKAYRGRCPHADVPLDEASFDGHILTCPHHAWGFDGVNGKCVTHIVRNTLHPYPLRVEDDEFQVDIGPVKPAPSKQEQ